MSTSPTSSNQPVSTRSSTITWLHLSDFHFKAPPKGSSGDGKGSTSDPTPFWQRDKVLKALERDVVRELSGMGQAPDLVFLTGDLAWSGKAEEYLEAKKFFEALAKAPDMPERDRWCLVPGNHDVDRSLVKKSSWRLIPSASLPHEEGARRLEEEIFGELDTFTSMFSSRQQAFFDFTAELLGNHRAWSPSRPWQLERFHLAGRPVAVLCLNSSWSCGRDDEYGKLLLGERQVEEALTQAEGAELRFALFHHPLEFLQEFDQDKVQGILASPRGAHLQLRGHLHKAKVGATVTPSAFSVEIAAGACWETSEWPHGVNVGRLDLEAGCLEVHLWRYSPDDGGFFAPDTLSYQGAKDGICRFPLPSAWARGGPATPDAKRQTDPAWTWGPLLSYTLENNRWLPLHGVSRPGTGALKVGLDAVYVELRAQRTDSMERRARMGDLARAAEAQAGALGGAAGGPGGPRVLVRGKGRVGAKSGPMAAGDGIGGHLDDLDGVSRSRTLHEALRASRKVAIIGDPGSGKTTLLRFVARKVAEGWLSGPNKAKEARELLGLAEDAPLPVPVLTTLHAFNRHLKEAAVGLEAVKCAHVENFLAKELASARVNVPPERLEAALQDGRLLLLLDGLDEVPGHEDRQRVARGVRELLSCHKDLRVVLTSRTRAFDAELSSTLGLDVYELQAMSREEEVRFLENWHQAVYGEGEKAKQETVALLECLERHRELRKMSMNPHLLTLIAVLKYAKTELPDRRVELYSDIIDLYLERWDLLKGVKEGWEKLAADLTLLEKRKLLAELAWEMHAGGEQGRTVPVKVPAESIGKQLLEGAICKDGWEARQAGRELQDWLELRSGLLVRRADGIQFAHLAYQECAT